MIQYDLPLFLATAAAVVLLGFAKGGLSGAGLVAMPLMSLAMPPLQAGAILLPILLVQDFVTVAAFRRTFDVQCLRVLIPGGIAGVIIGYGLATWTSAKIVEGAVGSLAVGFALLRIARPKSKSADEPNRPFVGLFAGVVSGFTSQIAHAGAPPFQIYMLNRRFSTEIYLGTAAIFFAVLDVAKLPAFLALGKLNAGSLVISVLMMPLAIVSNFGGVHVMRKLAVDKLYKLITFLLLIVGILLITRAF